MAADTPPAPDAAVGARIRALRTRRGTSLSALARAAGIGKGSLSELEAGRRNPTLATLYAVAGPLGVPLAALLDDRVGAEVVADGVSARLLDVHRRDDATVETYAMRFAAGRQRRSPAHPTGTTEHLVVTAGTVTAGPDEDPVTCTAPGQTSFRADRPHRYTAFGPGDAEAVLVIVTPVGA